LSQVELAYRADIDGLRALAVLPVVFYHAGFESFSGGFVGVDVFFVISGFLITSIIAGEIDRGTFRPSSFYVRRARRLFPALFCMMLLTSMVAPFLLLPGELEDFGESVATTALFTSNFLFFTEAGYFDGPAELKPLLHTWSLAIEEQYYLLFPGFLMLIHRFFRGRLLPWVLGLLVTSLAVSFWSVTNATDAAFYLLPSRTWELMLGSIIALTPAWEGGRSMRELLGWLGLGLVLAAVLGFGPTTPFPGAAALLPCVGTGLVIVAGRGRGAAQTQQTMWKRLLSLPPVVFVGLMSYSLYLWHFPVFVFARHILLRPLGQLEAGALIIVSLVLAVLSWRFVERPFRGAGGRLSGAAFVRLSVGLMAAAVAVGLVFDIGEGLPGRLPDDVSRIAAVADERPAERIRCEGIAPDALTYARACRINGLGQAPSFAVWGDSHGVALMPELAQVSAQLGRNGLYLLSNGCPPLVGVYRPDPDPGAECLHFAAAAVELLRDHPEIGVVMLVARWARYAEGTGFGDEGADTYLLATSSERATSGADNRDLFRRAVHRTLATLTDMGRRVVVIGPVPEIGRAVPEVLAKAAWRNRAVDLDLDEARFLERQSWVLATFAALAGPPWVAVRYPAERLCANGRCQAVTDDGRPLYFDDNHVSSAGAARLRPMIHDALAGAFRTSPGQPAGKLVVPPSPD
jgi:peptidoglycan/LPS O-acetylase OafA/YrhL